MVIEKQVLIERMRGLPVELSDLLELAVNDAKIIQKTPGYRLDMKDWHTVYGHICYVCLAGSLIAVEMKPSKKETCTPSNFIRNPLSADELHFFYAVDAMRRGDFQSAAGYMNLSSTPFNEPIVSQDLKNALGNYDDELTRYSFDGYMKAVSVLRKMGW